MTTHTGHTYQGVQQTVTLDSFASTSALMHQQCNNQFIESNQLIASLPPSNTSAVSMQQRSNTQFIDSLPIPDDQSYELIQSDQSVITMEQGNSSQFVLNQPQGNQYIVAELGGERVLLDPAGFNTSNGQVNWSDYLNTSILNQQN